MPTRIVFNGRAYSDPSEMPETVRREYEQALAQFEDANKNGIPDVLENASKNVVTIHQSSFTINGKTFESSTNLPAWAKEVIDHAIDTLPSAIGGGAPAGSEPSTGQRFQTRFEASPHADDVDLQVDPVETTSAVLAAVARALLVLSAIAVVVVATLMFRNVDASSASQGGRVWVVVGAVIVLVLIAERYVKFSRR